MNASKNLEILKGCKYNEEYKGKEITSEIAMEPGANYGENIHDSYCVEFRSIKNNGESGQLMFGSFSQMEEFANMLMNFVNKHRH